jgi:hypothetical protein
LPKLFTKFTSGFWSLISRKKKPGIDLSVDALKKVIPVSDLYWDRMYGPVIERLQSDLRLLGLIDRWPAFVGLMANVIGDYNNKISTPRDMAHVTNFLLFLAQATISVGNLFSGLQLARSNPDGESFIVRPGGTLSSDVFIQKKTKPGNSAGRCVWYFFSLPTKDGLCWLYDYELVLNEFVRFVVDGPSSSGRLSEFLSYAPIFHLQIPVAPPAPKPPVAIKQDNPVNEVIVTAPAQQPYSQPKPAPQVNRSEQQRSADLLKKASKGGLPDEAKAVAGLLSSGRAAVAESSQPIIPPFPPSDVAEIEAQLLSHVASQGAASAPEGQQESGGLVLFVSWLHDICKSGEVHTDDGNPFAYVFQGQIQFRLNIALQHFSMLAIDGWQGDITLLANEVRNASAFDHAEEVPQSSKGEVLVYLSTEKFNNLPELNN